jgi:hypothetical protein
MSNLILKIGLFGTCGNSTWRKKFIEEYQKQGIEFFNPQIDDWKPELADIEAENLAEDAIILFPVTGETYGTGSLAETGFSIAQAIRLDDRRDFVIMIEKDLDESLNDEVARKESLRARALVKQHLKKLNLSNLYIVENLDEMLEVSLRLYPMAVEREKLSKYNPKNTLNKKLD